MGGIDEWLERLSWIALILLPILVAVGGFVVLSRLAAVGQQVEDALEEAQTSKLLDILRYVEQHGTSDARLTVLIDIREREQRGENWWESDDRLYRAAERLCATYDHLGGLINFRLARPGRSIFLRNVGRGRPSYPRDSGAIYRFSREIRRCGVQRVHLAGAGGKDHSPHPASLRTRASDPYRDPPSSKLTHFRSLTKMVGLEADSRSASGM